jgi:peptidoglycan-associated lipoprotein
MKGRNGQRKDRTVMKKRTTGAMLALVLLASACAKMGDDEVPYGANTGFNGTAGSLGADGVGTSALAGGGTLPGTSISDRVLFAVDQATLSPEAIGILDAQIGWLAANPSMPILIEGHADERGTTEYNLALGSSRASAVRNYMVSRGIPDSRISIITYGRERPVATCAEESCFAQNRRAVTVVTGGAGA